MCRVRRYTLSYHIVVDIYFLDWHDITLKSIDYNVAVTFTLNNNNNNNNNLSLLKVPLK